MKTTVIHHCADHDGIFCREIARKFLPDAELIGWDFGDPPIAFPAEGTVYVLDISPDVFHKTAALIANDRLIWIDHHKSAIEKWSAQIPGYRIDGVAACRLAWQWFSAWASEDGPSRLSNKTLPGKQDFVNRRLNEPLAVLLAGEYDIWDKHDPRTDAFQFGLRSRKLEPDDWAMMLSTDGTGFDLTSQLCCDGLLLQSYQQKIDSDLVRFKSFTLPWQGLTFLVLNTGRFNSLTFAALDVPETGHDALMGFAFNGKSWTVSLYHAAHRKDIDLSQIAVKYGGGGHRGACGFTCDELPFL